MSSSLARGGGRPCPCHDDSSDPSQPFVRPNYFQGRLLAVDDLNLEQEYSRQKRSLHDRVLHGWGVVCGMEVTASGTGMATVEVSAGIAVDGYGPDIVVPAAASLQIQPVAAAGWSEVLAQIRRSANAVSVVSGKDGRHDVPSVQRVSEMIEKLQARIAALESKAEVHPFWNCLRRFTRRRRT